MNKKSLSLIVAMAAVVAPIMGQNPLTTTGNEQVRVRAIHAVPNAPAATISIGENELFRDVAFKTVTGYQSMPKQDDKKITIRLADGKQLTTTDEFDLDDDDEAYTILITPDPTGATPKVVILEGDDDAADDDDADESDLTVINASPQHNKIKVQLDDKDVVSGVDYSRSNDEDVKAGSYTLRVTNTDGSDNVIATQQVTLQGATAYTLLVFGQDDVTLINDQNPDQPVTDGASGALTTTGTQPMMTPATPSTGATPTPTTESGNMMSTMPVVNPGL